MEILLAGIAITDAILSLLSGHAGPFTKPLIFNIFTLGPVRLIVLAYMQLLQHTLLTIFTCIQLCTVKVWFCLYLNDNPYA